MCPNRGWKEAKEGIAPELAMTRQDACRATKIAPIAESPCCPGAEKRGIVRDAAPPWRCTMILRPFAPAVSAEARSPLLRPRICFAAGCVKPVMRRPPARFGLWATRGVLNSARPKTTSRKTRAYRTSRLAFRVNATFQGCICSVGRVNVRACGFVCTLCSTKGS